MESKRPLPARAGRGELAVRRPSLPAVPVAYTEEATQSDWQRYTTTIMRHKWLILLVTALGTAAGLVATRLIDPQYQAKAVLWVETQTRSRTGEPGVAGTEAAGWIELATSASVLDSVVHDLRLYLRPRTAGDARVFESFFVGPQVTAGAYELTTDREGRYELKRDDEVVQRGQVGDSIGSDLGFRWAPTREQLTAGRTVEFAVVAPGDAAAAIASALKVRLDPGGSFLRLTMKGENPQVAAATVNAIVDRMVSVGTELKKVKFQELADILGAEHDVAKARLDSTESLLRDFQVRHAGSLAARAMQPGSNAGNEPIALSGNLEEIRREREQLQNIVSNIPQNGLHYEAIAGMSIVQQSPRIAATLNTIKAKQEEMRTLRTRLTAEAAPVVALQQEIDQLERVTLPAQASSLVAELGSRERSLAPRAAAAMGALRRAPTLALEQTRLQREAQHAQELYNEVRTRYETARLSLISSLPDVRVLDHAVAPRRPAGSYAPLLIALAFITSLALAIIVLTVRDGVDPKVRYPEQVTGNMKLTILGAVPHVGQRLVGSNDASAPAIEALRALRLRVLHSHDSDGPLQVTITSPSPGDGKSFVSVNLALSFAHAGYRTLLIDGDVRRGAQHRVLDLAWHAGLTDVLAGRTTLENAVRETSFTGLSFLGSGMRTQRAPELLLSPKLKEVMDTLGQQFQVIIVDSPPLAAGVDPVVLASATQNLVLVLRSGKTDLPLALSKLEVLDSLQVNTIGAVLNDVRGGGAFKYYEYDPTDYDEAVEQVTAGAAARPRILGEAAS